MDEERVKKNDKKIILDTWEVRAILFKNKRVLRRPREKFEVSVGDVLYVAEDWGLQFKGELDDPVDMHFVHRATFDELLNSYNEETDEFEDYCVPIPKQYEGNYKEKLTSWSGKTFRSAASMPKSAARLFLTVKKVNIVRLCESPKPSFVAEKIFDPPSLEELSKPYSGDRVRRKFEQDCYHYYLAWWNRAYPEFPFSTNPEVVVINFSVVQEVF